MHFVYASNSDVVVGVFLSVVVAQAYANDWARRHRTTQATVKDSGGSVEFSAPVLPRVTSQGT